MNHPDPADAVLTARAKLNLTLEIFEREDDGYHRLRSLMQKISLADRIFIKKQSGGQDTLTCDDPSIPVDEKNIILRALTAYRHLTGLDLSFSLFLEKRIPHGAGLGGGSSDAAAILRYLNENAVLHGHRPLTKEELTALAASIGADVPFCLFGCTDIAEGIGEKRYPLSPLPPYPVLLLSPPGQINTAEAFSMLDSQRELNRSFKHAYEPTFEHEEIHKNLLQGDRIGNLLPNSFLPIAKRLIPNLPVSTGLTFDERTVAHGMSGSGPTVFYLFADEEARDLVKNRLSQDSPDIKLYCCHIDSTV